MISILSANFSNLAAILIIFQRTAAVFTKVLARSYKYSLQGDECTEGTKALFSVGEELGYEIYRSGLGNYLCCKPGIIYGAWNHWALASGLYLVVLDQILIYNNPLCNFERDFS